MGGRLEPLWKDFLLVDDIQNFFRAEMDASYSKIIQRLFAACQPKLAVERLSPKHGGAHTKLRLIVAFCG
jgi:hypothetical protein